MRTLRVSIVLCGILAAQSAVAQTISGPPAATPPAAATAAPAAGGAGDWKFDYHGYLRAPLRLGLGTRDNPPTGQGTSSVHVPLVPDDQYPSWQYTSVQSRDWAELFFSYGNAWAKGTLAVQGFQFTDAAWAQPGAQFGIGQGWITLTPPLGYQNVRLEAKVGSFWGKYGMAGKYDAGKYDTFLFGRTHQMGEAVKMEIDVGKFTLWAEEGFGAKQPDPSKYNDAKFSLLAHGHAGLRWNKMVDFGVHILHAWSQEEDRQNVNAPVGANLPDGKMTVSGAEIAVRNTLAGELYFGFSHIGAVTANTVDDVVEVLHAYGGNEFKLGLKSNYLDGPLLRSKGTGSVNSILLQYDFSVANLLAHLKGSSFWGDGPDLSASFFMMYNAVKSDDPDADGRKKVKFGFDILGTPLKWLGLGFRFDRVQPNSKVPEQSFGLLTPRLVFKTAFVTHEEVSFQFSRYLYNQRVCPATDRTLCVQPPSGPALPNGFGASTPDNDVNTRGAPSTRPDLNVIKIQGTMWW